MSIENLDLVHLEVIQEEGINVKELPESIQDRLKGFNLLYGKLKKNPEDERLFKVVQNTSTEIGDEIQNWLESDFDEDEDEEDEEDEDDDKEEEQDEDEEEEEEEDKNKNNQPKNKPVAPINKPKNTTNNPVNKPKVTPNPIHNNSQRGNSYGNVIMEKKIVDIIKANPSNRISIVELSQIIGKEPDYPIQRVHTLTLKKVFLSASYKLA